MSWHVNLGKVWYSVSMYGHASSHVPTRLHQAEVDTLEVSSQLRIRGEKHDTLSHRVPWVKLQLRLKVNWGQIPMAKALKNQSRKPRVWPISLLVFVYLWGDLYQKKIENSAKQMWRDRRGKGFDTIGGLWAPRAPEVVEFLASPNP